MLIALQIFGCSIPKTCFHAQKNRLEYSCINNFIYWWTSKGALAFCCHALGNVGKIAPLRTFVMALLTVSLASSKAQSLVKSLARDDQLVGRHGGPMLVDLCLADMFGKRQCFTS